MSLSLDYLLSKKLMLSPSHPFILGVGVTNKSALAVAECDCQGNFTYNTLELPLDSIFAPVGVFLSKTLTDVLYICKIWGTPKDYGDKNTFFAINAQDMLDEFEQGHIMYMRDKDTGSKKGFDRGTGYTRNSPYEFL
jgi:hypothetical protein